jgi:hypothetical protein
MGLQWMWMGTSWWLTNTTLCIRLIIPFCSHSVQVDVYCLGWTCPTHTHSFGLRQMSNVTHHTRAAAILLRMWIHTGACTHRASSVPLPLSAKSEFHAEDFYKISTQCQVTICGVHMHQWVPGEGKLHQSATLVRLAKMPRS